MTTLERRPNTALLVIDVQNGVVAGTHDRRRVVARITQLVEQARQAGVPVIWTQHADEQVPAGSDEWRIAPELAPGGGEVLVQKRYGDAFEDTLLEETLAEQHVGRVVVAGAQTDACVRSTLHGALTRGYDTLLVSDAHTTEDLSDYGAPPPDQVIAHTNLYWSIQSAPGREAGTITTAEIDFAPYAPVIVEDLEDEPDETVGDAIEGSAADGA